MAGQYDPTRSCVLQVTITHLIYPVTEKVLGQLFDAYGVNDVCLLQQPTHLEAFVEFQSWHEANKARSALHGRCIYDGCCLLYIQHAPLSISVMRLPNSKAVVVDWDQLEVVPLTSTQPPSASSPAPAAAAITSTASCKVSSGVHANATSTIVGKALESEEVVALPAAPHETSSWALNGHSSNAKESTPMVPDDAGSKHHSVMLVPAATNQGLDKTPVMWDDKEQVQVKNELSSAPEVFDKMTERIKNGEKLHRFIKWVSRVCIARPMRWVWRSKFCNFGTAPSQPPVPPHPPDQPVHHLDPCSLPRKPIPPPPPDPISGIGFVGTRRMLDSHTAHAAQLSFEQQKRGKVHGDRSILERLLGLAQNVVSVEEMCSIIDGLLQVDLLQGMLCTTLGSRSFFCSCEKQTIRHTYLGPSVHDYCLKSDDTFAASGYLYQAHARVHFSDALGATTCDIGFQVEWLTCSMGKLYYRTARCSFGANGRIISAALFEQWDPGINLGCLCVLLSQWFKEYFIATVSQLRHYEIFFSLLAQWELSKYSCDTDPEMYALMKSKVQHLAHMLWKPWDPGVTKFACWVVKGKLFVRNTSSYSMKNLLIDRRYALTSVHTSMVNGIDRKLKMPLDIGSFVPISARLSPAGNLTAITIHAKAVFCTVSSPFLEVNWVIQDRKEVKLAWGLRHKGYNSPVLMMRSWLSLTIVKAAVNEIVMMILQSATSVLSSTDTAYLRCNKSWAAMLQPVTFKTTLYNGDIVERMLSRIHETADLLAGTTLGTLFHYLADATYHKVFSTFSKLLKNKHPTSPWELGDLETPLFAYSDTDTWDPGGVCQSGLRASRNLRGRECHARLLTGWTWSLWAFGNMCWAWWMKVAAHIRREEEHTEEDGKENELNRLRLLPLFSPVLLGVL